MSVVCLCTDADSNVDHYKCSQTTYGSQIVAVLFQKPDGANFDGTAGNGVSVQADWDTRLAATDADKISVLPYIANSVLDEPEDTLAEDNEVPYGGVELEDRKQMITFDFRYMNSSIWDQIDKITNCTGLRRVWFLDNKGWIWGQNSTGGGIEDASIMLKSPSITGINTRVKITGNTVTWHSNCVHRPVAQLLTLQEAIDNLAPSGS